MEPMVAGGPIARVLVAPHLYEEELVNQLNRGRRVGAALRRRVACPPLSRFPCLEQEGERAREVALGALINVDDEVPRNLRAVVIVPQLEGPRGGSERTIVTSLREPPKLIGRCRRRRGIWEAEGLVIELRLGPCDAWLQVDGLVRGVAVATRVVVGRRVFGAGGERLAQCPRTSRKAGRQITEVEIDRGHCLYPVRARDFEPNIWVSYSRVHVCYDDERGA